MRVIYNVLAFIALTFTLFMGTNLFLTLVNGSELRVGGNDHDRIYYMVNEGFTYTATLLSIIFSIVIILLYKILNELKKLNNNQ